MGTKYWSIICTNFGTKAGSTSHTDPVRINMIIFSRMTRNLGFCFADTRISRIHFEKLRPSTNRIQKAEIVLLYSKITPNDNILLRIKVRMP